MRNGPTPTQAIEETQRRGRKKEAKIGELLKIAERVEVCENPEEIVCGSDQDGRGGERRCENRNGRWGEWTNYKPEDGGEGSGRCGMEAWGKFALEEKATSPSLTPCGFRVRRFSHRPAESASFMASWKLLYSSWVS
jgi:hypothetical protein